MPILTPIDKNPFDEFYDATGADKPAPVGKVQLLGNLLFGALPGPAKLASLPLNENFRKGFMEGMEKSGRVGVQSMMEALENQYKPDNAVAVNDAGEWLDQSGKVIPSQRRPNLLPITKSQPGEGWFGSNFEGAMPAMADVWNTMGGVAGKGGVSLGAGPMLRPALKYQDKIYKAKEGQQHLDALPADLYETFQKQAMSGEDISNFNFGFINHKGQFLSREKALEYAIKEGILDPNDAKYGTLVTTMLNDSGGGQKLASQTAGQARDWKVKGFEDAEWFHGTTHEFNKFSKAKGNVENHLGKYPHFSTSPKDAGANYAGMGPDLTARVERRAEELIDADLKWGTEEYNKAWEIAKNKAKLEIAGKHEGAIIPAKMKLDNPASLVDSKPTWIDFAPKYNKDGEWVKDNPNTIKLLNSLKKLGEKYNFNGQKAFDDLSEKLELFDSVKASDLDKALRNNEALYDAMEGDKLASSHVISEVFKALGYDGIVMDAKSAFPNMKNIPEGTLHAVPLKRNTVKGKYSDQILYNKTPTLTPVDYDPFKEEQK